MKADKRKPAYMTVRLRWSPDHQGWIATHTVDRDTGYWDPIIPPDRPADGELPIFIPTDPKNRKSTQLGHVKNPFGRLKTVKG